MKTARDIRGSPAETEPASPRLGDPVLGVKLKRLRESFKLTQTDVVQNVDAGISRTGLANIELGSNMPTVRTLVMLAAFYEASLDDLTAHMRPA